MNYRRSEAKEASKAQFHGVWAAITTPFTPDGQLDEAGLRQNMQRVTDDLHVDGVFCTGIMGEFWSLTKEERLRSVEAVVQEARGKCKVIAHTAHHSADETVELTRHAQEVGADFAILMNPYFPPANDAMIYSWFEHVASRVDIGIWMFDTDYSGYGLSAEVTARIAELENVCGIKIVWDMQHYNKVKELTRGRIVLSQPSEADWLTLIRDQKQQVHMSSPSPYIYQTPGNLPMRDYTRLGMEGRFDEAAKIHSSMQPLRDLQAKWMGSKWRNEKIIPIAYLKAWTELLGMVGGPVRPPLLQITQQEREEMKADLAKAGLLSREPVAV